MARGLSGTRLRNADGGADGNFYYSVETTGVYCRPSCPARLAKREHVRFHQTCADMEKKPASDRANFADITGCVPR